MTVLEKTITTYLISLIFKRFFLKQHLSSIFRFCHFLLTFWNLFTFHFVSWVVCLAALQNIFLKLIRIFSKTPVSFQWKQIQNLATLIVAKNVNKDQIKSFANPKRPRPKPSGKLRRLTPSLGCTLAVRLKKNFF